MERQSQIYDLSNPIRTGVLQRTTAAGRRKALVSGFVLPVGQGHLPAGQGANLSRCEGKDPPADF